MSLFLFSQTLLWTLDTGHFARSQFPSIGEELLSLMRCDPAVGWARSVHNVGLDLLAV